jgi:hypothetical protein
VSLLLPDGIDHLGDCPFTLHAAITAALRILNYEEFPIEERPPRRIWLDGERLESHWRDVERRREEKYKNPASADSGDDDEDDPHSFAQTNAVELITR